LYAAAESGALPNMTGIGQPYEEPRNPDLIVTGTGPVEEALPKLIAVTCTDLEIVNR
jgi:bifunctional enzyme CysN/CysC